MTLDLNLPTLTAEPLASHTTLRIGGPADGFVTAASQRALIAALRAARAAGLPWLVIGEGSNLLVSDAGYCGLVIRFTAGDIRRTGSRVSASAGLPLRDLIEFCNRRGLAGVERMAGIPGTLGGALHGNAGAYGQTISDHLLRVRVYNGQRARWRARAECDFGYRSSIFKANGEIILRAEFAFPPGDAGELAQISTNTLHLRALKYAPDLRCPGSFFQNVLAADLDAEALARIPPEKIVYGKVPAGYLLEEVGAKGRRRGEIEIAAHHANLFINSDGGTAADFYALAGELQAAVRARFGITLRPEVELVGFEHSL